MIVLRFTKNKNEQNETSIDNVNKINLQGLCGFDITDAVESLIEDTYTPAEAYMICARKEAEHDNWHATNHDGNFVIFEGTFVEFDRDNQDRFRNRAVVAKIDYKVDSGQIEAAEYGWKAKKFDK